MNPLVLKGVCNRDQALSASDTLGSRVGSYAQDVSIGNDILILLVEDEISLVEPPATIT